MKKVAAEIFRLYRPFHGAMLGLFLFIVAGQVLSLAAPYLQGQIIDLVIAGGAMGSVSLYLFFTLVVMYARSVLLSYVRGQYELQKLDFKVDEHVYGHALKNLLGFSIGQHTNENSALKQSVISKGQHSLTALAYMTMYQILPVAVEVVFLIGIMLYFSLELGLLSLCAVVGFALNIFRVNREYYGKFKKIEKKYHTDGKFRGEVLRNVELVLVNAQEPRAVKECDQSLKEVSGYARTVWQKFTGEIAVSSTIVVFARVATLGLGILLVYNGRNSVGELVMFLSWSGWAFGNLWEVGNLHRQLIQLYASVKKYFDMLAIESDVKLVPNPVSPLKFNGDIEFRNVTFSYRGRDDSNTIFDDEEAEDEPDGDEESKPAGPALQDVSFSIRSGEKVAFVGESGSGKSTTVRLLMRAQDPQEGQVVVDGNDLRVLDLKRFREAVGIVDQEVSLFDNTLRYNITYGLNGRSHSVTDEELNRIAEMSCVSRFFSRLEKGYDTIIGERGVKLSGGEKQRVGIARALIKEPDILIFDEATSNLDAENESLIRDSIERAAKGRTTIIIAHRFSTIRKVDKVVVFDKGRVVGIGSHADLADTCEPYKRLIQNQVF